MCQAALEQIFPAIIFASIICLWLIDSWRDYRLSDDRRRPRKHRRQPYIQTPVIQHAATVIARKSNDISRIRRVEAVYRRLPPDHPDRKKLKKWLLDRLLEIGADLATIKLNGNQRVYA